MTLSADTLTIIFYFMQQLGMMLGFGAQIVLLATYLIGKRDGVIQETEDHIAHGIYRVLLVSLAFVVVSGVGITVVHYFGVDKSIVYQPAFLFKWGLVAIALLFAALLRGSRIWNNLLEGLAGANWGALFLIHIFAPITTAFVLIQLYVEWLVGALVVWYLLVFAMRGQLSTAPVVVPIPTQKKQIQSIKEGLEIKPKEKAKPFFASLFKFKPKRIVLSASAAPKASPVAPPHDVPETKPVVAPTPKQVVAPTPPPTQAPAFAPMMSVPLVPSGIVLMPRKAPEDGSAATHVVKAPVVAPPPMLPPVPRPPVVQKQPEPMLEKHPVQKPTVVQTPTTVPSQKNKEGILDPDQSSGLPAFYVMPKRPEDLRVTTKRPSTSPLT